MSDLLEPPRWQESAECRGLPIDMFFNSGSQATALRVCSECSVRDECLADAIDHELQVGIRFARGVRGGLTAKQRQQVIRTDPRWRKERLLQPCGTDAAYNRHLANGEAACDECKRAHAAKYRKPNVIPLTWVQFPGKQNDRQRDAYRREAEGA